MLPDAPRRLRRRRKPVIEKTQFDPKSAVELTAAQIKFGRAMHRYKTERGKVSVENIEIFRVLVAEGYFHVEWLERFSARLDRFRARKRRAPTWSEVLACATVEGMSLEAVSP